MSKIQPRIFRRIFFIASAYVFAVCTYFFVDGYAFHEASNDQCVWNPEKRSDRDVIVIRQILEGGVADRAGIRDGDILIAINHQVVYTPFQAQNILNLARPEDTVIYTVERGGVPMDFPLQIIKARNPVYLALSILGFGFLIIGFVVGINRPSDRVPRLFFRMAMTAALVFVLGGLVFLGFGGYPFTPFWAVHSAVAVALFPAFLIHFFMRFPYEKSMPPWLIPSVYALCIALAAALAFIDAFGNWYIPIFFMLTGLAFGVFCHSYFSLKDPKQRRPLKSVLIGSAFGLSGFVYLATILSFIPAAFINHPESLLPTMVVILIPLSFGYSIIRYRLMDIDLIVKRSMVYAGATANIAVLYLGVLFLGNVVIQRWFGSFEHSQMLNVGVLVVMALMFAPIKERIQHVVDRKFFRERYDYQRALLSFSQELPSLVRLDEILQKVNFTLTETMHVQSMAVCMYEEGVELPTNYVHRGLLEGHCDIPWRKNGLVEHIRRQRSPQPLYDIALHDLKVPEEDKRCIRECGVVLAIPMCRKERLLGILWLGPKLSGRPYSQDDVDLLETVANQTAVALENARLHKQELEKARLENELNVARRIQQFLLPRESPKFKGLDIAGASIPALSVGGDYFDYIPLAPDRLLITIGDVSGKGASAALYMARIQGMIQMACRTLNTPKEILLEVNRQMYHTMDRQSFVTLIIALFDLTARTIRICRAGHNPLVAVHKGRLNLIQCRGIGVGLAPNEIFAQNLEEELKPLEPGGSFVFYTDGVTEAMNPAQEEFGDDRLYRLIQEAPGASSEELLDRIVQDVRSFCGSADQSDDMTLVIVRTTNQG